MENSKLNYSKELLRFIETISKEVADKTTEGILYRLAQITGEEREVYDLIVGEGFDITYDEFLEYYNTCKTKIISINGELSDDQLDDVSGGLNLGGALNDAGDFVKGGIKYVADNPGGFIVEAGTIGDELGTAIGGAADARKGATIGGAVGGGVGLATGVVVGVGATLIENEITK